MSLAQARLLSELRLAAVRIIGNPDMDNFVSLLEVILVGISIGWHGRVLLKRIDDGIGDLHKLDYIKMYPNLSAKIALA